MIRSTGNGYICGCGNKSQTIKQHRIHLALNSVCQTDNATAGDLNWIQRQKVHFGILDSSCGRGLIRSVDFRKVTCPNCISRLTTPW